MSKKQFFQFSGFVVLTLCCIYFAGQLFRDKDTTMASFYSEPKNTIEVITVGSSHVNSGVIPAVFWQEQSINAHNVFSWSQPMWISYHYIKEAQRSQNPKVVVLDLFGMMYGNSGEQPQEIDKVNYRNSFSIDTSFNFLSMTKTVENCGIDLKNSVDFLNIVRFHTAWKDLSEKNFTTNTHNQYSFLKGYGVQGDHLEVIKKDTGKEYEPQVPYETAVKYLDKIVELSKKDNFELVFVMLPYDFEEKELPFFEWLKQYSQQKEIPFYNYCLEDGERIGFDYATDFADPTHTNYKGAYKISQDIADIVKDLYTKQDVNSLANKEILTQDAQQVYRILKVNGDVTDSPLQYAKTLISDNDYIIFSAMSKWQDMPKEVSEMLQILGVDPQKTGVVKIEDKKVDYASELEYQNLSLKADTDSAQILFLGKEYMPDTAKIKFAVYDKVLKRPTFYFYYDQTTQKLVVKDYPAKS